MTEIDDVQVLDLWARVYAWVHADWAPVADEAVERHLPSAPEDVGAVMRAVVRLAAEAGEPMLFDGHVSDPNYPQVLATIPHVTGVGLELLRLG